jgi:hypothetical protein
MRTALFWVITQRVFLNHEDRADRLSRNVAKICHYSLRNNPEERSSLPFSSRCCCFFKRVYATIYQCSIFNVLNAALALHRLIQTAIKGPLIREFYFVQHAGGRPFVTLSKGLQAVLPGPWQLCDWSQSRDFHPASSCLPYGIYD